MSDDERRRFLTEEPRVATCAVTRKDGRPHATPIWFVLDGDDVVFNTSRTSVKGHAIRRDGRVSVLVHDDVPPFAFVLIEGECEISEDVEEMLPWATEIGARYMGVDRAEEYGRRNAVATELLVRVTPAKVVAESRIAD
jgi:PPOX class probable F420-dependent enzyme